MQPPSEAQPRSSIWTLLLAAMLAVLASAVLFFLTIGVFGTALLVIACVFGLAALHYVVWGRWLGAMIERQVEAERLEAERKSSADEQLRPPPPG